MVGHKEHVRVSRDPHVTLVIVSVVQCIYLIGMLGDADRSAALVLLLALPVYWGLFAWLFDLTFVEALQATFLIGLIQKGVNTLLTLLAAGILLKMASP
jgi:hypothetical protein